MIGMRGTWAAVCVWMRFLHCSALLSSFAPEGERQAGVEEMEIQWSERTQADLWPRFLGVFETTAR